MTAFRVLLMMLMCLVTDAPGPITPLFFEHLEDGEEVRVSHRRTGGQRHRLAQTRPVAHERIRLVQSPAAPRPRPAAGTALTAHGRKAPPPVPESAAPPSSEDH